jgi:hypothetical protein
MSSQASAATSWLEQQMAANGNTMPGFVAGSPDVGLTEDAVLALTSAGLGNDNTTRQATAQIASHVTDFVSLDNFGIAHALFAGGLAKSLLVAEVQGADGHAFGGRDIEQELRSTRATSGASTGRFEDQKTQSDDTSNGFSQALGILALQRTSAGVPADAVTYLLAQQCPTGGFRLFYDTSASCTDSSQSDTDSTGLAVQALAAVAPTPAISAALTHATTWLKGAQSASAGSFGGSGPTAGANTNSTGLAVAALRLEGADAAADSGASYVEGLQLGSGKDKGAIAYNKAAFTVVKSGKAIGGSDLDQWRRASVQAVLALGLPSYGQMDALPAGPLPAPTSSPSPTHSHKPTPKPTHAGGHHSTSSSTSSAGATVLGESISDPDGQLAATGGTPIGLLLWGFGLLIAGVVITVAATDRTARHR